MVGTVVAPLAAVYFLVPMVMVVAAPLQVMVAVVIPTLDLLSLMASGANPGPSNPMPLSSPRFAMMPRPTNGVRKPSSSSAASTYPRLFQVSGISL